MLALLLAAAVSTCPPNPAGIVRGPLGHRLDEEVRRMTALGAFAGVVLVARGDTVLLHRGYGRANDATCAPMTPDTRFDIASVAKSFTGAALLLLEQDGRLKTSDSLARWFPDAPADQRAITLHQLVTHTSGLPEAHEDFFAFERPGNRDPVVREILAMPLDAPPGARYRYSNLGYNLLAAVIERASGLKFESHVRERILKPLGMTHTGFLSDARTLPDAGVAHAYWDFYDAGSPRERTTSWYGLGGSQIVSTAGDLHRWLLAMAHGDLLPPAANARWTTPDSGLSYAYGWHVVRRPDGTPGIIFHSGGFTGTGAEIRYYRRTGLCVIVLTNRQYQDQLMQVDLIDDLAQIASARSTELLPYGGPPPAPGRLANGIYDLAGGGSIRVWRSRDGRTWLAPDGQAAFDLLACPDTSAARRVVPARERTVHLLDSLRVASCSGIQRHGRVQAIPATLMNNWCALTDTLGAFRSAELLGVRLPGWSDRRAFVFTRARFERGTRAITWLWEERDLVEAWQSAGVPDPQSVATTEESPGVLLVYDWFRRQGTRLTFGPGAGGRTEIAGIAGGSLQIARLRRP